MPVFLGTNMQIKITDDGIVSFIEEKILKQVEFKNFIEQMNEMKAITTGFLPKDCIYFKKQNNQTICIFEDTPQIRFLTWKSLNQTITYPLSLPFVYWIIIYNQNHVVSIRGRSSLTPVRSLDKEVFNIGLPNFHDYGSGEMCRGGSNYNIENNPHSSLRDVVNKIWETNWNGDLTISFPDNVPSYKLWAEETLKDPLFWMKLKLKKCGHQNTLGGLIEIT